MAALVLGLVAAGTLLSPWRLKFAIDARELYKDLYPQAAAEAETRSLASSSPRAHQSGRTALLSVL